MYVTRTQSLTWRYLVRWSWAKHSPLASGPPTQTRSWLTTVTGPTNVRVGVPAAPHPARATHAKTAARRAMWGYGRAATPMRQHVGSAGCARLEHRQSEPAYAGWCAVRAGVGVLSCA